MSKVINKKTGIGAAVAAVVVIAAVVITTSFSNAMSLDEAKEIAKEVVPETATFQTSEEESTRYEVLFRDDKVSASYEVEVLKEEKKVKKVEMQLDNDAGSKEVKLSKAQAEKIVKEKFKNVISTTATLNKDNGLYEYEISFKGKDFYGDADVNAATGVITESTIKYGTVVVIPNEKSKKTDIISLEEAKAAALKACGDGVVTDCDLDNENNRYYYEIEVTKNQVEYDYIVDGETGKATLESEHKSLIAHDEDNDDYYDNDVEHDTDDNHDYDDDDQDYDDDHNQGSSSNVSTNQSNVISLAKAKSIVLSKINGAKITKIYLEKEDGRYVYEGEATLGQYEYDFEINASSGVITGWEKDRKEVSSHNTNMQNDDDERDYDDDDDYDDDEDDEDDD